MQTVIDTRPTQPTVNGLTHNGSSATAPDVSTETTTGERVAGRYVAAVARISIGFVFLWAFFDKLLALGYATGVDRDTGAIDRFGPRGLDQRRVAHQGIPLRRARALQGRVRAHGRRGLGRLAVHVRPPRHRRRLMLGIGMRIAAASGALLLVFMWMASLPLDNNPFMDDHLIYAVVLIGLAVVHAGDTLGARSNLGPHRPGPSPPRPAIVRSHGR